jgi:hypothetical protein
VLNACYSSVQARSISSAVQYVVGMNRAIGDIAAIKFSTGFYDALASGRTYPDAFRFGCNAISLRGIPEFLTPILISSEGTKTNESIKFNEYNAARVASMQELVSLLDFRADLILSAFGREGLQDRDSAPSDHSRDMKISHPIARQFAELHEQNKQALIDGRLVLSHELTAKVRDLLSEYYKDGICGRYMVAEFPRRAHEISGPNAYNFASQYPGPLPEHFEREPNQAVLMLKQEEEERRREQEKAEEEQRRSAEEATRREAEEEARRANQREHIKALQDAARKKGVLKEGDRCPKCGFSYAWDGTDCHHCHFHKV